MISTAQKKQSLRAPLPRTALSPALKTACTEEDAAQDLQARIEAEDKGHLWLAEVLG